MTRIGCFLVTAAMSFLPNLRLAAAESREPGDAQLVSPVPHQVIQREGFVPARAHEHQPGGPELGFAIVSVSGRFPREARSFEYRVVPQKGAFGRGTDWTALDG